ncbi:MAG: TPM domain-containing protein [Bacteroidota bacterium]
MSARKFFTQQQLDDIKMSVQSAELDTSGEIRVHIEEVCKGDVLDRAAFIFQKLGMTKTELRNGVLIYLAIKNRKFAIIGDGGINSKVHEDFWDKCKSIMLNNFRDGLFTEGLCQAVLLAGEQLKQHFPHQKDDVNELPDDVSFDL